MIKLLKIAPILISLIVPVASNASQAAKAFSVCMTDSLNGKERKLLARWAFLSMSAHPIIGEYVNVPPSDLEESDKFAGELFTRLITEDCPDEALRTVHESGTLAFQQAFGAIGEVAVMELSSNETVAKRFSNLEKYIDQEKINRLLKQH